MGHSMILALLLPLGAWAAAPASFSARFNTTAGVFEMEVVRSWAPLAADRFYTMLQEDYFQDSKFYRAVPNFVVQFGISANTSKTKRWDSAPLPDERSVMSSVAGTVAFAQSGSNSRSSQIFVNLRDNLYLDELGFAPFAVVTSGMHVA